MSNIQPCPKCSDRIDATQAALEKACPECGTHFGELVEIATDDYTEPEIEYPIDAPGGTQ